MKLILASGSPRRKEILEENNFSFDVIIPQVDETMDLKKTPFENVKMVSLRKAKAILGHEEDVILACDTIVVLDNTIYGKPKSKEDAYNMLKKFSGNTHQVISGVAIVKGNQIFNEAIVSQVTFKELSDLEINAYLQTNEPYDKAGAYAIQGIARKFVEKFEGSLNNIIGLPIEDIKDILKKWLGE